MAQELNRQNHEYMKKEFIIGASVIVAALILFFGINYLKGINLFHSTNHYYSIYTNVAGLTQSAPVNINGFKVGIVREIKYLYDNPGHVKVELDLDKELRLTKGSRAVIVSDMLGTSSVNLVVPGGTDYIEAGSTIEGGVDSGLLDNVANDVMPQIVAMIPKIDSILVSINTMLSDPAIKGSVQSMERTMNNVEKSSVQLNRFMNQMPALAGDAKIMMGNLNNVTADVSTLTTNLKNLPIESTMSNIQEASKSLNSLLAQLNNPNSTLGALTHDRQLYDNLNKSARSLDSLLIDVKKNPKRYISIKLL